LVPQLTLQVFRLEQSRETSLGRGSPFVGAKLQVAPALQVQLVSTQVQAPEHDTLGLGDEHAIIASASAQRRPSENSSRLKGLIVRSSWEPRLA
jgi:hypothetical protein